MLVRSWKEEFDLIMISTCCNQEYIYKLIDSVLIHNKYLSVCIVVVNQTVSSIEIGNSYNNKIVVIEHGKNENTSKARNIGIDFVINSAFKSKFVCFPDDDSSFDANFFIQIKNLILSGFSDCIITDVYCTENKGVLFRKINLKNDTKLTRQNYNIVGAVNLIVDFSTFIAVGRFDERFGVNAQYGAGEDGDYYVRALKFGDFFYKNSLYSLHPSGEGKFYKMSYYGKRKKLINYGKGVIAFLCKNKMYGQGFLVVMRGLAGALTYLFKFRFALSLAYFEAFLVRMFYLVKFLIKNNLTEEHKFKTDIKT